MKYSWNKRTIISKLKHFTRLVQNSKIAFDYKDYEPSFISKEYYDKILKYNWENALIRDPDYRF